MEALERKLAPFREVGGSNSKIKSNWKPGDNKDSKKDLWKEHEKEKSSSTTINPSQY
jgi:hypothetical protein